MKRDLCDVCSACLLGEDGVKVCARCRHDAETNTVSLIWLAGQKRSVPMWKREAFEWTLIGLAVVGAVTIVRDVGSLLFAWLAR